MMSRSTAHRSVAKSEKDRPIFITSSFRTSVLSFPFSSLSFEHPENIKQPVIRTDNRKSNFLMVLPPEKLKYNINPAGFLQLSNF
jgi:hypothetical protein